MKQKHSEEEKKESVKLVKESLKNIFAVTPLRVRRDDCSPPHLDSPPPSLPPLPGPSAPTPLLALPNILLPPVKPRVIRYD